ncbi:MAG: tetratricopeptide repeat protein [Pseudomonadota bacterium]
MDATRTVDLSQPFRLGECSVYPAERVIRHAQGESNIEPKVMAVLLVLAAEAGKVVARSEIFDRVWPGAIVSDEALSRCIYQLRKHLAKSGGEPLPIKTIPKKGYCLTLAPTSLAAQLPRKSADRTDRSRRWLAYVVSGALVLLIGSILLLGDRTDAPNSPTAEEAVRGDLALAVLPFADLSESSRSLRFGEAFPQDLLTGLGRLSGLRVSAWASSSRFALTDDRAQDIGDALGVDVLLTGTIRVDAELVEVRAELIDVAGGTQIWADAYVQDRRNTHLIQTAIAQAVNRVLDVGGDTIAMQPIANSVAAYDLYIEGRHYLNRRNAGSLQQAIRFFELAVEADPEFAEAWSGLADAHMIATQYQLTPLTDAIRKAQPAIDRALALNPGIAEPVASQGLLYLHAGDFENAANTLRRAAAMNPNYSNAHNWLGRADELLGNHLQALEAYRRGLRLDPLSTILNLNVARVLSATGSAPLSQDYFDTILKYDPDFPNTYWALGYISYKQGDLDASIGHYRVAFDKGLRSPFAMAQFAVVHVFAGNTEQAAYWLQRSDETSSAGQTHVAHNQRYRLTEGYDDWLAYADRMVGQRPGSANYQYMAGQAETSRGRYAAAVARFEKGRALDQDDAWLVSWPDAAAGELVVLDYVLALQRIGEHSAATILLQDADELITRLRDGGLATPAFSYSRAALHALSGDNDAALAALREVGQSGWPGIRLAATDPKFSPLSETPAFQEIVAGSGRSDQKRP